MGGVVGEKGQEARQAELVFWTEKHGTPITLGFVPQVVRRQFERQDTQRR